MRGDGSDDTGMGAVGSGGLDYHKGCEKCNSSSCQSYSDSSYSNRNGNNSKNCFHNAREKSADPDPARQAGPSSTTDPDDKAGAAANANARTGANSRSADPYYVDTHCHLDSRKFDQDSVEVARRALAAKVKMLTVAAGVESSYKAELFAEECIGVRAAVGVHPTDSKDLDELGWSEIGVLARNPRVLAIGETGLDYYWKDSPPDVQKEWFRRHIELALELGKPLSVHARDSVGDVLALLEPHFAEGLKVIWHCFVAGKKEIGPALDFAVKHGVYLGIGGLVTFEDQKPLREYAAKIPNHLLLLETDAPYLSPRPKKSDRNEPTGVIRVAEVLAELRGTTPDAIRDATTANAFRVLGEW